MTVISINSETNAEFVPIYTQNFLGRYIEMPPENLSYVIDQIPKNQLIVISGAEPTIHSQFKSILSRLSQHTVILTTNATQDLSSYALFETVEKVIVYIQSPTDSVLKNIDAVLSQKPYGVQLAIQISQPDFDWNSLIQLYLQFRLLNPLLRITIADGSVYTKNMAVPSVQYEAIFDSLYTAVHQLSEIGVFSYWELPAPLCKIKESHTYFLTQNVHHFTGVDDSSLLVYPDLTCSGLYSGLTNMQISLGSRSMQEAFRAISQKDSELRWSKDLFLFPDQCPHCLLWLTGNCQCGPLFGKTLQDRGRRDYQPVQTAGTSTELPSNLDVVL